MSLEYWLKQFEDLKDSLEAEVGDLAYLDLSNIPKPKISDLAHNLRILSFRSALGDKVNLTATHVAQKQLLEALADQDKELQGQLTALKKALKQHGLVLRHLQETLPQQITSLKAQLSKIHPLTKEDVRELVLQLIEQPKAIERQTEELTQQLSSKVDRVERLIRELENKLIGL
ncbi:ORF1 [Agave badnavirus A]|nr:ORF1 [Agave badnavirus A]